MRASFLFLGTGGSMGIPVIGCDCPVCLSPSPHNKRWRSSGVLKVGGKTLLIDAGPDFREQALRFHLSHVDAVLLTHPHFDHVGGLDDLRVFYFIQKKALPCFLSAETLRDIQVRYSYFFSPVDPKKSVSAQLDFQLLQKDFGHFQLDGLSIDYLSYFQAGTKVTGFRVGEFAYISDIREYSEEVITSLKGVGVLVLSALRYHPTLMHFSVDEAIAFSQRVGAKKTYFTHIAHDIDHEKMQNSLPSDVCLSYDGLEIYFEGL